VANGLENADLDSLVLRSLNKKMEIEKVNQTALKNLNYSYFIFTIFHLSRQQFPVSGSGEDKSK